MIFFSLHDLKSIRNAPFLTDISFTAWKMKCRNATSASTISGSVGTFVPTAGGKEKEEVSLSTSVCKNILKVSSF